MSTCRSTSVGAACVVLVAGTNPVMPTATTCPAGTALRHAYPWLPEHPRAMGATFVSAQEAWLRAAADPAPVLGHPSRRTGEHWSARGLQTGSAPAAAASSPLSPAAMTQRPLGGPPELSPALKPVNGCHSPGPAIPVIGLPNPSDRDAEWLAPLMPRRDYLPPCYSLDDIDARSASTRPLARSAHRERRAELRRHALQVRAALL